MLEFTKEDRNLLNRVSRTLRATAQLEANGYGPNWGASAEGREAKRRYDRILRDERDLTALRKRLEAQMVPLAPAQQGGG